MDIGFVAYNINVNSDTSNLLLLALTTQKVLLKVIYDNNLYFVRAHLQFSLIITLSGSYSSLISSSSPVTCSVSVRSPEILFYGVAGSHHDAEGVSCLTGIWLSSKGLSRFLL
jgi:hypothetical protein